jgi:hypothetical protein
MAYRIEIDGEDRTNDVLAQTLVITDQINEQVNTCDFAFLDQSGLGMIAEDEEIIITMDDDTRIFAGYIVTMQKSLAEFGVPQAAVKCVDYTRLLDRRLAHLSYEGETDAAIIEDLVDEYAADAGITTTHVLSSATIDQLVFNYVQLSQAFRKIAELTQQNWYIDYEKDIHYFPLTENPAPFNITADSANYEGISIKTDATQIKNRIYLRGGTRLSDFVTFQSKGDGVKRQFVLPDKPSSVSVTVNGVAKSVGIKNIDTSGYDYYLNYQEKYIEQDAGATVLGTGDTLVVTYKYAIPILVAQDHAASIAEHGVHEFPIFDKSITTTDAARERAVAELTDFANSQVDGGFQTWETGFRSGQYININHAGLGVNDDYIIQKVTARSIGGGVFKYTISLANAKKVGIIRFLIGLLEANKNLIDLDPNEVIDELFLLSDSLLGDSLVDSLQSEVGAPPFKYGSARYGLAEFN